MRGRFTWTAILGSVAMLVVACGTSTTPSAGASGVPTPGASGVPASAASVAITYWSHDYEPRIELDKELIDEFSAQNPGIDVTYETFPYEDYETKVFTAIAGGTGPDLFNLFTSRMGEAVSSGAVMPIDFAAMGLDGEQAFRDLYTEGSLDLYAFDGKLYAVPTEVSNMALYVNQDRLREAGLDPTTDIPTTWEGIRDVSSKLVERQGDQLARRGFEFTYGVDIDNSVLTFESMAYQLGGGIVDADSGEVIIDGPPAVEALQYWYDWVYKDKLGDPALPAATDSFCDGSVAMTTVASWFRLSLEGDCPEVAEQIAVVPFPRYADGVRDTGAFFYGYGELVSAASSPAEQQAAWKLAAFLASRPADYLSRTALLQPRKELEAPGMLDDVPFGDVFFQEVQQSSFDRLAFETWEAVQRAIERSTQNQIAPAESLRQAKGEIEQIIAR